MYQFDNGFKLEKKRNNWEHLQKFFKRNAIGVTVADWDPVMHCAPQAAYELLKKSPKNPERKIIIFLIGSSIDSQ